MGNESTCSRLAGVFVPENRPAKRPKGCRGASPEPNKTACLMWRLYSSPCKVIKRYLPTSNGCRGRMEWGALFWDFVKTPRFSLVSFNTWTVLRQTQGVQI